MDNFDPASTLGPDDPLRAWLEDPAMADFVRQKAIEHASSVLGYTEPDVPPQTPPGYAMPQRGKDTNVPPLRMDDEFSGSPNLGPMANIGRAIGVRDQQGNLKTGAGVSNPSGEPYVMDKGPATGVTPPGSTPPPAADTPFDPVPAMVPAPQTPIPQARPEAAGPGNSDVSASKKKKGDLEGATNDFAKTLAGVKALQPPPVNAVGTPSVRSPGAISAPAINQILQLMGAQSRPDPIATLGRLLVAGKA